MLSHDESKKTVESVVGEAFDKGYECGYKAAIEDVGRVFEAALMDSLDEKDTKPC